MKKPRHDTPDSGTTSPTHARGFDVIEYQRHDPFCSRHVRILKSEAGVYSVVEMPAESGYGGVTTPEARVLSVEEAGRLLECLQEIRIPALPTFGAWGVDGESSTLTFRHGMNSMTLHFSDDKELSALEKVILATATRHRRTPAREG